MAAVTQKTPTFIGGVSQQTDDKKQLGQLRSCLNGYPDPTFGLIKRAGGEFIAELKNSSNTVYGPTAFDNGHWFSIFRDSSEQYLGVIKANQIYIWDITTGAAKTVAYTGGSQSYLTGTTPQDYQVLSINDSTYITNKTVTVTAEGNTAADSANRAFITLKAIVYEARYRVTINGTNADYTTPATGNLSVSDVLSSIKSAIDTLAISGLTATIYGTGIHLSRNTTFNISVAGGQTQDALEVFQTTVPNISKLPSQCVNNYKVRVVNSNNAQDDYYAKFIADNGAGGTGVWEEDIGYDVSTGITDSTMPHELVRLSNGTFEFRPIDWEGRLVGDNTSNPMPSFVGSQIKQLFFYKNRFGALTDNNVVFSQVGDYYNFFATSALTTVDADPIDITVSTTKPAVLSAVVPVVQGLIIFSSSEQFIIGSANDTFTPSTVTVRTLSRYEYDTTNQPADLGVSTAFLTSSPVYTRVFELETLGNQDSPVVSDITRPVPEWIPSGINLVTSSSQNGVLALAKTTSRDVYLFLFFNNGERREISSWFQWRLSGLVQYQTIQADNYWYVTKQEDAYVIQKIRLVQSPASSTLLTTSGNRIDPRLDMWKSNATATYDANTGHTKVRLPYNHDSNRTPVVVIANSNTNTPAYANAGFVYNPPVETDANGDYLLVEDRNLSTDTLIVGYRFNMQVELPRIYFRSGQDNIVTDVTASLTIARLKFNLGLSGDVNFKLRARGRSDWTNVGGVNLADYYIANDIPFLGSTSFTVPVHQRNENFDISIESDTPFPVSLISMTWEGNYIPKIYSRA